MGFAFVSIDSSIEEFPDKSAIIEVKACKLGEISRIRVGSEIERNLFVDQIMVQRLMPRSIERD